MGKNLLKKGKLEVGKIGKHAQTQIEKMEKLRNRLIVFVLSPIQDRSRLTETSRNFNTEPVPPIRPSFLDTL